ncbi:MAG: GNAT family N-acetyltransferase [Alicyclobacillus herbarius]|uniref:GNAT family N-acetyltransferase n=1 Tax=Alicyclobacillus herbarius TaxID=122960 RepID=UPI0003FFBA33|nr:GNAT family N-acetyltransferase [Alicyclobacillus herbarius]MCL6632485.1 GNAT family N-acetyltransferase [Alicyclobacillus herbarius]
MHALVVRTEEQLQECLQIRREVFIEEQGVPEELEMDELDRVTACTHLLVRDARGCAQATARVKRLDDETGKVQRVAVRKAARGGGYGRIVMEAAEAVARQLGCARVVLDAQCQAQGFYERLGYRVVSPEKFLDAGIWHVRMEKELSG